MHRRTFASCVILLLMGPPLMGQLPMARADAAQGPTIVASDLAFPSNMAFAPDGRLFFAEKDTGNIRVIEDGELQPEPLAHIDVLSSSEQGLLGLALDPAFAIEPWVYVYYSDPALRINRLARFRADADGAGTLQPLLDALTTENGYHNGGDVTFGADGMLYLSVGEVHESDRAQDPDDLGGKVLRVEPDGTVPDDDPFGPGNPAYSMGHRNSFGLCVDPSNGDLWETENGPGSDDEVNLIRPGGNYGWPDQLGPGSEPSFIDPVADFPDVIVPTGCAVWRGDLVFGAFGTRRLYRLPLPAAAGAEPVVAQDMGAGVTDLQVGPDGDLYVATSDAIWRLDAANASADLSAPPDTVAPASPTATAAAAPPADDGSGGGGRAVIAIVAGVALIAGLVMRFIAGRRLRRDTTEP